MIRRTFSGMLVTLLALLLPRDADACPVCFGDAAAPLLDAARAGVLAMVAITVVVLALFARWFLRLRRLSARGDAGTATEARS